MKPSEEIVRFFEKDRFAAETGAVIDEIDDRYARCSLTLEAKHKNALGAVMGGVYFTLADFAFAVASNWQGDTIDRKSTRLNSSHSQQSRMPSSA